MKRLSIVILFIAFALELPLSAQSTADKSRRDALKKEISVLDKRISELGTKASNAEKSLVLTRKKIEAMKRLLEEDNKSISSLNASISDIEKEVRQVESDIESAQKANEQMMRSIYLNRDPVVWFSYVLTADGLPQTLRRYTYLKTMSSRLSERKELLERTTQELARKRSELEARKQELSKTRDAHNADLSALASTEKREKDLVKKLNADKKAQQKTLAKRKNEMAALEKKMASMVSGSSRKGVAVGGSFASAKGKLGWPVEGVVSEKFGQHNHPVYKNVKLPFNNGVNISVEKGAKARAVFEGEVRQVVVMPGYNQCVLVQHGSEWFTFYCKLSSVDVKAGQKVKAGTVIGTVETQGGSAEFHFELWKGRSPQNPESWLVK